MAVYLSDQLSSLPAVSKSVVAIYPTIPQFVNLWTLDIKVTVLSNLNIESGKVILR